MKNLTWQNPEQLFVAQELINKVKSKCCGIKDYLKVCLQHINIYNYLKKKLMENQELQTTRNQSIVTIGDWIITMILMCIPFVNFIMLLVWAFSAGTPVSKANWAKATLIFMLIGFVLVILFWGAIGGLLLSNM